MYMDDCLRVIVRVSFDFQDDDTKVINQEMWDWLKSEIGKQNIDWKYIVSFFNHEIYFKCEEDKVKFILRWL